MLKYLHVFFINLSVPHLNVQLNSLTNHILPHDLQLASRTALKKGNMKAVLD